MEIFLVGGAIRNKLLGLPVDEYDWVVIGSTPEEMIKKGYKPVGKDFPVFLHPDTHEEYALARTERKIAKGYKGFEFHTSPDVSLLEDLKRRDLTINAIAQSTSGALIDPYGGQEDLTNRLLRHVSPAFSEDPVRILRLARFAAQLPNFSVHHDTLTLMNTMVDDGEIDALVPERVWKECEKALNATQPSRFFEVIESCNANQKLWPELSLSIHNHLDFNQACATFSSPILRFALLVFHLSPAQLRQFITHYKIPNNYKEIATLLHRCYPDYDQLNPESASEIVDFIKATDALRRPERFADLITLCCFITNKSHVERLNQGLQYLTSLDISALQQQGLSGKELGDAIYQQQIQLIHDMIHNI